MSVNGLGLLNAEWQSMAESRYGRIPNRTELPGILLDSFRDGLFAERNDLLAFALIDSWLRDEYPNLSLDTATWTEMFRDAGFVDRRAPAPRPMSVPTLFRAAVPGQELGMSWADDRGKAEYFHERHRYLNWESHLLVLDGLDPCAALAHNHGPDWRDENEWIIDTSQLASVDLTVVDRIAGKPPPRR